MGIYKAGKPFTMLQDGAIDSYTKLLIHSNTSDGSTTFVDSSATGHTITVLGTAHHESDQYKFGGTSMHFDGNSDYLTIASTSDFQFGTGDFTVDWWMNPTTVSGTYLGLISITSSTTTKRVESALQGSNIQIYTDTSAWRDTGFSPTVGQWTHIALVRNYSAGTLKLYANGVEKWSVSNTRDYDEDATGKIGHMSNYYNGYIDEIRISKGIARWTEPFSPPSSPYPTFSTFNIDSVGTDISNKDIHFPSNPSEDSTDVAFGVSSNVGAPLLDVYAGGNVGIGVPDTPTNKFEVQTGEPSGSKFSISSGNDSYTKLLIQSDDIDGNTTFIDSSANSHVITAAGNTHHEIDQKVFGATSMYFDGTGDYLHVISSDFAFGTINWTIDFWMNQSTTLGWASPVDTYGVAGNGFILGFDGTTNYLAFYSEGGVGWQNAPGSGGSRDPASFALTNDTWYHVAYVRNGNAFTCYVDGAVYFTVTLSGSDDYTSTGLRVGQRGNGNGSYEGYLDEVRVSKGIARWTSNFTPPTRPYGHELTVDGPRGKLYTVTDSMETHGSGSIFSVNTTGGVPVLNVLDNGDMHTPHGSYSGILVIADDSVASIVPPREGVIMSLICAADHEYPQIAQSGTVFCDTGTSLSCTAIWNNSQFDQSTSNLTGTTGNDTYVTVSCRPGVIQVENRIGSTFRFHYTFIG